MPFFSDSPVARRSLFACVSALALAACGGSGSSSSGASGAMSGSGALALPGAVITDPNTPIAPLDPGATGSVLLTTLQVVSKSTTAQTNVPLTFGQVFPQGALPASTGLTGTIGGMELPLQLDVKARHADGSVRHAIISTVIAQLGAGQTAPLALMTTTQGPTAPMPSAATTPGSLLASGFDATVKLTIAGQSYTASAAPLLQSGSYTDWLSGTYANEWLVSAPFKGADNVEHPHLAARFAIRSYAPGGEVRVDVTIENNWAYELDPKNFTYDAQIVVNGQPVYNIAALTHLHHARWRKQVWAGEQPKVHLKHESRYLIASKSLPNYDQSVVIAESALVSMKNAWDTAAPGPMGNALLNKAMGTTGGRPDIGLHHAWAAMYTLSMDERAKDVTVGLSELGGSWPIHYRDKNTGQAVSILAYPYARTIKIGSDSYNPVTKKHEDLPVCTAVGQCATTFQPDTAHQPSLSFLPYLVTGDAYHLDELHFWANWNLITKNPAYRKYAKGIVSGDQVRGQAWTLRTLAHAAYITPDTHPLKAYFNQILDNNLEYYNTTFAAGNTNQLGFIDNTLTSYAVAYPGPNGPNTGVAPWQDDFFTSAIGHIHELGYAKSKPLLDWKARFPVGRMMAPQFCWIDAAAYKMSVRASATSPYYASFREVYLATMRTDANGELVNSTGKRYLDQPCASQMAADWRTQLDKDSKVWRTPWVAGEMTGYATSQSGYPSNMQPALAVAASTGIPNAQTAWTTFINRPVKPNYGLQPQFAIVPR